MKILPNASIALAGFLTLGSVWQSESYPTGAATCLAGDAAPGGPHSGSLKGSISDGGYQVDVDGSPLGEGGPSFKAGEMHTIKISALADSAMFKGFLIRVSSEGKDVSGSLSDMDSPEVQIMASTGEATGTFPDAGTCAETVAGASHTNKEDKSEVSAGVMIPSDFVGDVDVEVTVVMDKVNYYYSPWKVAVDSQPGISTQSPTPAAAPTESPPTDSPPTDAPPSGGRTNAASVAVSICALAVFGLGVVLA